MQLKNPFTQKTRLLFLYEHSCFDCGRSDKGLELHHIVGRASNSPLNAYLICMECHSHANHSFKEEAKYLQQTLKFLMHNKYNLTEKDIEFYNKHRDKYL